MNELLKISASTMAERIRKGELSSQDAVEAHIAAIERVNPAINAVVVERFNQARDEAVRADTRLREEGPEGLGPFHGVPCTVKEAFALSGMPNTGGLVARKGRLAQRDATAVQRLRQAGAIVLGLTNISELCMWMESENRVYGRANNPYDTARIPGGSSGGEGAIVGSGASPMGLGADIGGSIRMPAFFCGAFGHKPSGGLVPGTGQFPISENEALRYLCTGPITRRAEDLFPFLKIIAGPDGQDPGCEALQLGDPSTVRIDGLRVINVADNGVTPVSRSLREAQQRCADQLASQGADVSQVRVKGLRRSLEIWSAMMSAAAETSFRVLLGDGRPISFGRELLKLVLGRSEHTLAAWALALVEELPLLHGRGAAQMLARGADLKRELELLIGDGVMLYPPYASTAPRHGLPLLTPLRWVYTAIINVMQLPSTQVPLGLDGAGLPLGVQVVGSRGNDHRTIAVACALEKAFGGWVPPARIWG